METPSAMYKHHIPPAWATSQMRRAVEEIPDQVRLESVLRPDQTFHALKYFHPRQTKVVILGQDPYPTPGKAHGLAFGLHQQFIVEHSNLIMKSSFAAIMGEVARTASEAEGGFVDPTLVPWAEQGVLLLNTQLSCAPMAPMSHAGVWDKVVEAILEQLPDKVVWLAWGGQARDLAKRMSKSTHWVLEASHPCKFSATRGANPFIGCDHFNQCNTILDEWGMEMIDWVEAEHELVV